MARERSVSSTGSSPGSTGPSDGQRSPNNATSSSQKKGKSSKPRLTDVQKNTNHKDAENKRRNAIREQFTRLSKIVPGTEGRERSEYEMLKKSVVHFKQQIEQIRQLTVQLEAQGVVVEENLKMNEDDWGGPDWTPTNFKLFEKSKAKRSEKGSQNGAVGYDDDD